MTVKILSHQTAWSQVWEWAITQHTSKNSMKLEKRNRAGIMWKFFFARRWIMFSSGNIFQYRNKIMGLIWQHSERKQAAFFIQSCRYCYSKTVNTSKELAHLSTVAANSEGYREATYKLLIPEASSPHKKEQKTSITVSLLPSRSQPWLAWKRHPMESSSWYK